ncbi:RraA family protein [Martelella sp. AMO21009]
MSDIISSHDSDARFPWITTNEMPVRVSPEVIARFERIDDLSSTVSDVLDELGLLGALPTSVLRASLPDRRIVGSVVTVRNTEQTVSAHANAVNREWRMAEILGIAAAAPGDVLLIEGVKGISNMGGLMATIAEREGLAGAVVDGGVRDLAHSRSIDFPIWSRDVSPVTGKWRSITQEINGPVRLAGLTVSAGDLVIADETGICFVPRERAEEIVARCEAISAYEAEIERDIAAGMPLGALIDRLYGGKVTDASDN